MSGQTGRNPRLIIAAFAVVMLLVGFGTGFYLKPSSTETTTELSTTTLSPTTYTTTVTAGLSYRLSCVVTYYEVDAIEYITTSGQTVDTSTTRSQFVTSYTTNTSIGQIAGYTTSTSTSVVGTTKTTGPLEGAWTSTVCTWLQ